MQSYELLEKRFGEWRGCQREHTVACSSGTAALHLAIESLDLPLGSEIICPDFTMVACARAIVMAGMKPVFVDCRDDLLVRLEGVLCAMTNKTRAILAVHIYGRQCDMDFLCCEIACANDLRVIEDLAEAHGVVPHEDTDAVCWSFYRNKIIHGEEGGMIAFKRPEHAEKARCLRSLGFTPEHNFDHVPRGHNYRMSNCHADLILQSLDCFEEDEKKRRQIEACYNNLLPPSMPPRDAVWVYDVKLDGINPAKVVKQMNKWGYAARQAFKPMHTQIEFADGYGHRNNNAARMSSQVMYLPVDPSKPLSYVGETVGAFKEALRLG